RRRDPRRGTARRPDLGRLRRTRGRGHRRRHPPSAPARSAQAGRRGRAVQHRQRGQVHGGGAPGPWGRGAGRGRRAPSRCAEEGPGTYRAWRSMRMRRAFHRLGLSSRGRWAAALLGGSAAAVVLLFAPWREGPAQLELVALTPDGSFASSVAIPASWADTLYAAPGIAARVPLILGVRNTGGEPARPQRVEISAPSRIHLTRPDGRPLQGYTVAGSPLIR